MTAKEKVIENIIITLILFLSINRQRNNIYLYAILDIIGNPITISLAFVRTRTHTLLSFKVKYKFKNNINIPKNMTCITRYHNARVYGTVRNFPGAKVGQNISKCLMKKEYKYHFSSIILRPWHRHSSPYPCYATDLLHSS